MQTAQASAAFVVDRAQHSIHLLEGLRAALLCLGHPELARIAEIVSDDACAARCAAQWQLEKRHRAQQIAALREVKTMARMAGPASLPAAIRAGKTIARL